MISIPIMNEKSTNETRDVYLHELQRAKAQRVFICMVKDYSADETKVQEDFKLLAENISYYTTHGLEVGVWTGGLGHGGALAHDNHTEYLVDFTRIRGLTNAGEAEDSFCPLDPLFFASYSEFICRIAKAGAKMIMIDDDLRLAFHGPARIGCACERHMNLFNERAKQAGLLKHDYTREELADILFTGETNPERRIWFQLMGDTMRDFAKNLRRAVDVVDPTIRLGQCACLSTWDLDGIESIELSKLLAGNTKPFFRLVGAPYWNSVNAFRVSSLGTVADIERMQFSWCSKEQNAMEIFAEGDVYPRPRYRIPSSYLEGLHQVLCAEGHGEQILKYMLDYVQDPSYEKGYVDRHVYYEPLRAEITTAFASKQTAGVYVHEVMRKLENANCAGMTDLDLFEQFTPMSLNFAEACSLPISFTKNQYTNAGLVFGENAKYVDDDILKMPLVLDAYAAKILTQRGVDVGLYDAQPMEAPVRELYISSNECIPVETEGQFWQLTLRENTEVLSTYAEGIPAAYTYENAQGIRYLVYAFEANRIRSLSTLWQSYSRQNQLFEALNWMDPNALPVTVTKEPGLYLLCRKSSDSMAVGIWNFGQDLGMPRCVVCDEEYDIIETIGDTDAVLEGNVVHVKSVIAPCGFNGFVLKKQLDIKGR